MQCGRLVAEDVDGRSNRSHLGVMAYRQENNILNKARIGSFMYCRNHVLLDELMALTCTPYLSKYSFRPSHIYFMI